VGLPPGTSALMLKFIPPETLKQFGGAQAYAEAIDASLDTLADLLGTPDQIRCLLLGDGAE
jgi:L-seryl-tRNA(Ser) seleniumtransferase